MEAAVAASDEQLGSLWRELRAEPDGNEGHVRMQVIVTDIAVRVLQRLYPGTVIALDGDVNREVVG